MNGLGRLAAALALPALLAAGPAAGQSPPEPEDYRQDAYQAPAPATLAGVPALTTEAAKALWSSRGAIFVDVLPHAPKPAGLPAGTIWNEKPHLSVPGATWLPEVGRGALSGETDAYFRRNLAALTKGDPERPLVIFCKRNCWMSWNAARRAESYGYRRISWYADGIDGWSEASAPLAAVQPAP